MKTIVLAVLTVISSVAQLSAQEQKADTIEYKYPIDVIVTAPRMSIPLKEVPFSASIVDQYALLRLPRAVSVEEALEMVPGVKVDNQSNGMRVHLSIRGQGILTERGIRGIRILYDGIPVNDPTGFAPDFYDVDFNTVAEIEVLRGAAAALYGGSASGGIVNIITQNSPITPLSGETNASFGTSNFWKGFGQFGGSVHNVNYRLSSSRTMGDGYRMHSHFWGDNVYGKATYIPSKSLVLTPIFDWTSVYHENPEGIDMPTFIRDPKLANPDAEPFNEFLQTERTTNGITGLFRPTERSEFQFSGYVKRTLFTEANNGSFAHRKILTPGSSLQYLFSQGRSDDFLRNRITTGTDLQWQTIDEYRKDNILSVEGNTVRSKEQIKQRGLGLFLIDKVDINTKWGAMLSVRYDKIHNELNDQLRNPYDASGSANFEKTTGRFGITYSPRADLNLFTNWGQGFLPPATEELAQNPDNYGGFNRHLTSATSNGFDLGVRGDHGQHLYYDITGFYLKTKNDFDRYRITDPLRSQETFYRNAGSSRRVGLESYARFVPMPMLELQAAYTYSNFKYTINDSIRVLMDDPEIVKFVRNGNWLPNSPQHQFVLDAEYRLGADVSVGVTTETLSKTYIDGANVESEAAPGYTLIHARVECNWHVGGIKGALSIQGRNLGGKKYIAFTEPDPGGNSYQPGPGREFFAGLRLHL
jgi:iron complex outermembrane recepter protein